MPWDLSEQLAAKTPALLIDVREPEEFKAMHIEGSANVPRGILETACEYGFEETMPVLADARPDYVVIICRSGNRSLLAAKTMQLMGYENVVSLQTGLRGWNDYECQLVDANNKLVNIDDADIYFTPKLAPEQLVQKN